MKFRIENIFSAFLQFGTTTNEHVCDSDVCFQKCEYTLRFNNGKKIKIHTILTKNFK